MAQQTASHVIGFRSLPGVRGGAVIARAGVLDLRQYTLVSGGRDTLIELFDRYFVDGQEDVGMHIVGQFRDLDDPDRFVWLRGFESMATRGQALPAFYGGLVWKAHSAPANATMVDSDNALLLEPTYLGPGYPRFGAERGDGPGESVVSVTVAHLTGPITDDDRDLSAAIRTDLAAAGADVVAAFTTHDAENNFPGLPLRDEHVLVWITRFPDDAGYARHRELLSAQPGWQDALHMLAERSSGLPIQQLRLRPTERSHLR